MNAPTSRRCESSFRVLPRDICKLAEVDGEADNAVKMRWFCARKKLAELL
jgi:hypothetical protein